MTKPLVRHRNIITDPNDNTSEKYPSVNKAKRASRELQRTGKKIVRQQR